MTITLLLLWQLGVLQPESRKRLHLELGSCTLILFYGLHFLLTKSKKSIEKTNTLKQNI